MVAVPTLGQPHTDHGLEPTLGSDARYQLITLCAGKGTDPLGMWPNNGQTITYLFLAQYGSRALPFHVRTKRDSVDFRVENLAY